MEKHFFDMKVDSISRDKVKKIEWEKSKVLFTNSEGIPEGDNIKIFQGVFSQKFEKGQKSRNGYKYDQEGWFIDNYERLPIILWQHDDAYGWIWFTQELWLDTKGNLCGLFYVDLEMLEERNRKQVERGYVKSMSTGAITIEDAYEHNETGKRYTYDEAEEEFGWMNVLKALWGMKDAILTYVVTKAELVENSMVTIWSNYGAQAKSVNSLSDEMKRKADELQQKYSQNWDTLLPNDLSMTKKDNDVVETAETADSTETTTPEVEEVENTEEVVETAETADEAEADTTQEDGEVSEEVEEVEENKIQKLENKISDMEKHIDTLQKDFTEFKNGSEIQNKVDKRENQRKQVLASVPSGGQTDGVKTMSDFTKKYFNK